MARQSKNLKRNPYIIVFWEGESEEQYMKYMRQAFHTKANLKVNAKKGVFEAAKKAFSPKGVYADEVKDVDEIWLVFDTEPDLRVKWDEYWGIVQGLRKKCKYARVRLLMTKGCVEYFFLLHYEKLAPSIVTTADKDALVAKLSGENYCPGYKKGDQIATFKIASSYETGIENGKWSLKRIEDEFVGAYTEDEKYRVLDFTDSTFTNAHEAIEYLRDL